MNERRRLRVLAVTSLFPNAVQENSSAFNRQQFSELAKLCDLEVWAPVPWFPMAERLLPTSSAAKAVAVPTESVVAGLEVLHPRTLQVPVVGRPVAGPLYATSLARHFWRRRRDFDVVLATWAYPDGWAAVALGQLLSLPTVVKVHGSDINVVARKLPQRLQLRALLPRAAKVIAVSRPLAEGVARLGVDPSRTVWIPNGVDSDRFDVRDAIEARDQLGIERDGDVVVYIGNLKREKGVFDLLDAWPLVVDARPHARLFIVGDGPERDAVGARTQALSAVSAVGPVPHDDVAKWISASNLLCLPSWNEGTPNVVLEAHASGRAVVACAVGGVPDLVHSQVLGRLVPPQDSQSLGDALAGALASPAQPDEIRRQAEIISWRESAERIHRTLQEAAR